jgi:hypothetical protein
MFYRESETMKKDRLDNELERTSQPAARRGMNNPGIDLAIWKQLRKKWAELQSDGRKLKIDFRLVADPENERNILAIDVIQNIDGEIVTETVQRNAGEAYRTLGIAGLSRERLVEAYKGMMHDLYRQTKHKDADLIVSMSPSSPASGEVSGYIEKHGSGVRSSVTVNYQHYYLLNALRERMMELEGKGWSKVRAVYRLGDLEFYFEY